MMRTINKLCKKTCGKFGFPKYVCLAIVAFLAIYLIRKYVMPNVEGLTGPKKLVFAHMDGCRHCDDAMPEWDKFVSNNKTSIKPVKIESKQDPDFMKKHEVAGFPTFLLLSADGKKIKEYEGARKSHLFLEFAEQNQ